MPIYEFYCRDCHTIYSFFSRRVDTETVPACPKDSGKKGKRHRLQRQMSRFAISTGQSQAEAAGPDVEVDDEKMEQAMMHMAGELDNVDDSDPRAMANLMRKMMDTTGLNMGPGMEEAIRRMEAGEDPDQVEEELGDVLEAEDPFTTGESKLRGLARRISEAPDVDPEVYDM